MTTGEKIKRVRVFRGLTQRDLGLKLGYEERNADVRVAQYESGYRSPRKETLVKIASVLNFNHVHLTGLTPGCPEEICIAFLWLEEENKNVFHLFELEENPEHTSAPLEKAAILPYNTETLITQNPIGLWIDHDSINRFLKEWVLRKKQLKSNEISEAEYFEWKINWPNKRF